MIKIESYQMSPTPGVVILTALAAASWSELAAIEGESAPSWPVQAPPAYSLDHITSSYSSLNRSLNDQQEFAHRISAVYATLLEKQESLGADFEAVWDENVDRLYES